MPIDLTCFNWVQLIKKSKLPSNAKLLGFYLATFMNAEHNIAWPAQSRIAHETGLTEPTVRKYLQLLEENGWLIIKKNVHHVSTGKQNYLHNEYLINIPQGVISLLSDMSRGKNDNEQGVNSSLAGGKEFTTNNNRITKNNNGRFTPPTQEEIEQYCRSRNNQVDYIKFYDFYTAKGWMVGKNKMKDWKAAIRTWERSSTNEKETYGAGGI